MIEHLTDTYRHTPAWALSTAVSALALAAVVISLRFRRTSTRLPTSRAQPPTSAGRLQAVVDSWCMLGGIAGMSASMWGLWKFARETAHLPELLQYTFIAVLDATEIGLFLGLYLALRNGATRFTGAMHYTHRLAWALACLSSAAQVAEFSNGPARLAMGSLPLVSAMLINARLRVMLAANQPTGSEDQEEGAPGPLRLITLLWRQMWTRVFDRFGLEASGSTGAQTRRAQVRRAARLTLAHRDALEAYKAAQHKPRSRAANNARTALQKAREAAQLAREQADVATDPRQRLAYMRRMAWLTNSDTVSELGYEDPAEALRLMDRLNIADTAELLSAESRLQEARQETERSERARDDAEHARQQAKEKTTAAQEDETAARQEAERARQEAADAREAAERAHKNAASEAEHAENARQALATTRREEKAARARLEAARDGAAEAAKQIDAARREEKTARDDAEAARREEKTARRTLSDLNGRAEAVRRELNHTQSAHTEGTRQVEQLQHRATALAGQIEQARSQAEKHAEAVQRAEEARKEAENRATTATQNSHQLEERANEARAALRALGAAIADQLGESPESIAATLPDPGGPMFNSEGMETAWRKFRTCKQTYGHTSEPRARELAELGGVAESRARAWLTEFRTVWPRVVAAEQAQADAELGHQPTTTAPSAAEHPRERRLPAPSSAEQSERVNRHPAAV